MKIDNDPYSFNPEEVAGDNLEVLKFQIPYEAEKRLAGLAVGSTVEISEA